VSGVEEAVAQLGARIDLDKVTGQVARLEGQLEKVRAGIDARVSRLDQSILAVNEGLQGASASHSGAVAELRASLDRVSAEVAALRALPRSAPSNAEPAAPPPAIAPAVKQPELPPEIQHHVTALADADPGTRFSAVDKLLRAQEPRVLPALLPMAKDDNVFVRRLTVEGLRDYRRPETVEALLVALSDPEPLVRVTAHASLLALTGQKLEFDDGNATTRAAGVRRWQEWWDKNRASFAF
jgi:hypothetical protein